MFYGFNFQFSFTNIIHKNGGKSDICLKKKLTLVRFRPKNVYYINRYIRY